MDAIFKKCSSCGIEKDTSEFYKDISRKDGLTSRCKQCSKEYSHSKERKKWEKDYRKENIQKRRGWEKDYRDNLKEECFLHYGKICKCCGESNIEFLTIHHVNGNGNQHRREIGVGSGGHFYIWLKKNNFPEGFAVLCFNCNCALGNYGYCPHQKGELL